MPHPDVSIHVRLSTLNLSGAHCSNTLLMYTTFFFLFVFQFIYQII